MESSGAIKATKRVRFLATTDTRDLTIISLSEPDLMLTLTEDCSPNHLHNALKFLDLINAELDFIIAGSHDTLLDQQYTEHNRRQMKDRNNVIG